MFACHLFLYQSITFLAMTLFTGAYKFPVSCTNGNAHPNPWSNTCMWNKEPICSSGKCFLVKRSQGLFTGAETLGGRSPPKFEVGDGPCIIPPNIFSSVVGWCARKSEQSKKGCFSCEERVKYDILHSKDTENVWKERENPKNLVDD